MQHCDFHGGVLVAAAVIRFLINLKSSKMARTRIVLVLVCLLASFAVVNWMRAGFNQVADEPTINLSAIPYQLGPWQGRDTPLTEETKEAVHGDGMINRSYQNSEGVRVSVHVAAWVNHELLVSAPHHPEICYPAAGWSEAERQPIEIPVDDGTITAELIHFERGYDETVTCHWFQMADYSYRSGREFERSRFHGQRSWPNTFKVLVSTPGDSIENVRPALFDIATRLHQAMLDARTSQRASGRPMPNVVVE